MKIGSLFSGIGGIEMGLERALGAVTVWQVEQDPYCLKVLVKHWPEARRYTDVRTAGPEQLEPVDIICGGFPCQDLSGAGRGKGLSGARSGLWYEMLRITDELRPRWIVIENVNTRRRWLLSILQDLAAIGYDGEWQTIAAADVGAPHIRRRCFVIAHPHGQRLEEWQGQTGTYQQPPLERSRSLKNVWAVEPNVGRVAYGIPCRVDRLRCLGNAVVPQVAELVGLRIKHLMSGGCDA